MHARIPRSRANGSARVSQLVPLLRFLISSLAYRKTPTTPNRLQQMVGLCLFAMVILVALGTPCKAEWVSAGSVFPTLEAATAAVACHNGTFGPGYGCVGLGISPVPGGPGCSSVPTTCAPNKLFFNEHAFSPLNPLGSQPININLSTAVIAQNCPTGTVVDVKSSTGCSPTNGTQPGKSTGKASDCPGAPATCDPITIGTGNMYLETRDYSTVGQNKLNFTRYYNSRTTFSGSLGPNWRSTYDRYLQVSSTSVIAERPDGQQLTFAWNGSAWVGDSDIDYRLTKSGTTWTLVDPNDTTETYTTSSAGVVVLASIQWRNGYTQTPAYNGAQLTSVTDSYSRSLAFTYNTDGTLATLVTPENNTFVYGYDSVDRLSYAASPEDYPGGATYSYRYENTTLPSALTGVENRYGERLQSWTYDAYGRALTNSLGGSTINADLTTLTYNDTTGDRTVTNALGVTDTYSFSTLQGVPKVSGISRAATSTTSAATESFTYDSNGYLASATDWNGNQTTYTNNGHGLPTAINEAVSSTAARTTTIAYDTTWTRLPATVTTTGLTTTFTYDSSGNTLTRTLTDTTTGSTPYSTNGQTRTFTYTYDSTGHVLTAKNPRNNTTTFTYDSSGALTKITNPLSQEINITSHTAGGYPLTVTDSNSVSTTIAYDTQMRPTSNAVSTSGGTRTTTFAYWFDKLLYNVTLPDSSALSTSPDAAQRPVSMSDTFGNTVTYTLNALGNRTAVKTYDTTSTLKRQRTATFDALGRMLTDVGGASQTTTYTYDKSGNALTIKDGRNNTTTRTFDALNRLKTSTDAASGVTQYAYDAHDRVLTVTDPKGNTTSYTYSGFGDVKQEVSPDRGTTVYQYDANGNMTSKTDAASVVTNQTFDALDRVLTTTYPSDSTLNVSYTYDQTGTGFTFGKGRLTTLTDAAGTLTRKYDERGNLLENKRIISSTTRTTSYGYDVASRIASITYPSGTLVTYTRDGMGRTTNVAVKAPGASTAVNLASGITYAPFGPMTHLGMFNSVTNDYGLDLDYRITTTDNLSHTIYTYDNANNVTNTTDWSFANGNATYTYDALNRLVTANSPFGFGSQTYAYDANGNMTTQNAVTITYTSGTNRLATQSWTDPTWGPITKTSTYSATGNLTDITVNGSSSEFNATYNAANRLKTMSNVPQAATNVYDAFGQRITRTPTSGGSVYFDYDQTGTLLEEQNGSFFTDYIYVNGRLLGLEGNTGGSTGLYYVITDRLGTARTATDSSGASVWGYYYYPYGVQNGVGGTIVQNLRFPGQYADQPLDFPGFYYNINRDYYTSWGRYIQPDPIGLAGGLNPYAYAKNNPLTFTDALGLVNWNLFDPQSSAYRTETHYNPPDAFSIAGHGSRSGINIGDGIRTLAGEEFIDELARQGYVGGSGQTIVLHSCRTGAGGDKSFAQWLANRVDAPVVAPDDDLYISTDPFTQPRSEVNSVTNQGHFWLFRKNAPPQMLGISY